MHVCCSLVRFDLGIVAKVFFFVSSFRVVAILFRLFSISSDASGGFHREGM